MQQRDAETRVVVQQWPRLQPVEQFVGVRRVEDGAQSGIAVAPIRAAAREGEQVQVVIAKDGNGGVAE